MNSSKQLINLIQKRNLHISSVVNKSVVGRYKISVNRNFPLTYEMSQKPHKIAHTKSWNSWNTSGIEGGIRESVTTMEDIFLRRFIDGTFHDLFVSEIIIKRIHNTIRIAGIITGTIFPSKIYFLIGYSEELLSSFLKCPVKIELQSVKNKKDVVYRYI